MLNYCDSARLEVSQAPASLSRRGWGALRQPVELGLEGHLRCGDVLPGECSDVQGIRGVDAPTGLVEPKTTGDKLEN